MRQAQRLGQILRPQSRRLAGGEERHVEIGVPVADHPGDSERSPASHGEREQQAGAAALVPQHQDPRRLAGIDPGFEIGRHPVEALIGRHQNRRIGFERPPQPLGRREIGEDLRFHDAAGTAPRAQRPTQILGESRHARHPPGTEARLPFGRARTKTRTRKHLPATLAAPSSSSG